MMLANPMSMTLPTTPSLIYPAVNVNFGQPLLNNSGLLSISMSSQVALNLSKNTTSVVNQPAGNVLTQSGFFGAPSNLTGSQPVGGNSLPQSNFFGAPSNSTGLQPTAGNTLPQSGFFGAPSNLTGSIPAGNVVLRL